MAGFLLKTVYSVYLYELNCPSCSCTPRRELAKFLSERASITYKKIMLNLFFYFKYFVSLVSSLKSENYPLINKPSFLKKYIK